MVQSIPRRFASDFAEGKNSWLIAMSFIVSLCWASVCLTSQRPGASALGIFLLASAMMLVATIIVVGHYHRAGTYPVVN